MELCSRGRGFGVRRTVIRGTTRSSMIGVRAGAFRSDVFTGGGYVTYRSDFKDLVFGVDGLVGPLAISQGSVGFQL